MLIKRKGRALLALAVFGSLLVFTPSVAHAANYGPFHIYGYQSEKCIDDPNNSHYDNVWMDIYTCIARANNETFVFSDRDPTAYWIKDEESRKCLVIQNNSTDAGAHVIQYTCTDGPNEEWYPRYELNAYGHDYYELVAGNNLAMCLTVQYAGVDNNAKLVTGRCTGPAVGNQLWTWF